MECVFSVFYQFFGIRIGVNILLVMRPLSFLACVVRFFVGSLVLLGTCLSVGAVPTVSDLDDRSAWTLREGDLAYADATASITSDTITPQAFKPVIIGQPEPFWVSSGGVGRFSVHAEGSDLTYQWYKGASGDVSLPVSGATSSIFDTSVAGTYWVEVSNSSGSTASFSAALRNNGVEFTDSFVSQSKWIASHLSGQGGDLVVGGNALNLVCTETADGVASLSGSPMLPSGKDWTAEVDLHVPSSSFANSWDFIGLSMGLTPAVSQEYLAIIRANYERSEGVFTTSTDANFLLESDRRGVVDALASCDVCLRLDYIAASHTLTYWIDPDGASGPLGFQAQSQRQIDATLQRLGVTDTTGFLLFLSGRSSVPVSAGNAYFKNFRLHTQVASIDAPAILTQPQSKTVVPGKPFSVSVEATGTNLRYQWFAGKVGEIYTPLLGVTGSDTDTVTLPAANVSSQIWAMVYNEAGTVYSEAATITLETVKYTGIYFGSLGKPASQWALHVDGDNKGWMIAYDESGAWHARVDVAADGTFNGYLESDIMYGAALRARSFFTDEWTSGWERPGFEPHFTGVIYSDGNGGVLVKLLSVDEARTQFGSGELYPHIGPQLPYSGGYSYLSALDGEPGYAKSIVSAIGSSILWVNTRDGIAYASMPLDTSGKFSVTLSDGSLASGEIDSQSGLFSLSRTSAGKTIRFAGRALGTASTSRLSNFSINTKINADESVTAGFVIRGSSRKPVLVRGVGPSLKPFLNDDWQRDTSLVLNRIASSSVIDRNNAWGSASINPSVFEANNHFTGLPFDDDSGDSALLTSLDDSAGGYTVEVKTTQSEARTALAEIYDASDDASTRLINLSALSRVSSDRKLTAGFVIAGNSPKRVLIRAVGPSLANYGIPSGYLADPKLEVFRIGKSGATLLSANDNWGTPTAYADVTAATEKSGAGLILTESSKDAAVALVLAPGMYTVEMSSADGQPGKGLIEVYEAD